MSASTGGARPTLEEQSRSRIESSFFCKGNPARDLLRALAEGVQSEYHIADYLDTTYLAEGVQREQTEDLPTPGDGL